MDIVSPNSSCRKNCAKCNNAFDFFSTPRYDNDWCKDCLAEARANAPKGEWFCSQCKDFKVFADFYKNRTPTKKNPGGCSYKCRPCASEYVRSTYTGKKERDRHLIATYGITQSEYNKMFARQRGCCAICGEFENAISKRTGEIRHLAVDHDHENGNVRGLLCNGCNAMIGYAREDPIVLKQAIAYLKKHS